MADGSLGYDAGQQFYAGLAVATVHADFDFETKSAAGYNYDKERRKWSKVKGVNAKGIPVCLRAYVEHPTFGLLSLAYDLKDGRGRRRWKPGDPLPEDLFEHVRAGKILEAHNSEFEWNVWTYHCVPVLGWPALALGLAQLRCSMAKARAHAYPGGLDKLGEVLGIEHGKHKDGKRLIDKFSKPRNPTKTNPALWNYPDADPVDGPKLYAYNEGDILSESEASIRCPDLSPFELDVWLLDQKINDRGIRVDMIAVENCIAIVEQAHAKYNAELWRITGGTVGEASELEQLQNWLSTQQVPMVDMTDDSVQEMLARLRKYAEERLGDMGTFGPAYRALEIRSALGSASVKKLFAIRAQRSAADRLHSLYMYYGSRTGRWTGAGPQPQNLYKGSFKTIAEIELCLSRIATRTLELVEWYYGDALEAVNNCMRSLFIASPGKDFVSSDYTGIENVVAAGLAGEEWILEVYRGDALIYEATASMITGIPLQEFIDHKKRTGKHHPMRNKMGKFGALGSQFGGWIGAWKGFGADEFLTDEEIKAGILAWRAKSPNIVETWGGQSRDTFDWNKTPYEELYGLEGAAIKAVQNPGQAFYGNAARTITLQMHGDALYMACPGGGLLTYHRPRLYASTRPYAQPWELELSFEGFNTNQKKGPIGWIRMKLYGGILFENAVQHVARMIMAGGMLRLEAAGYAVVMHTHDEPVTEAPEGFGSVEEVERIMCDVPAEFAAWPIKASGGWRGKRYVKLD
jgi:DNA polymerase